MSAIQMTLDELNGYRKRFNEIIDSPADQHIKDMRLANLMSDLEDAYGIPTVRQSEYAEKNRAIMQLYRMVSAERKFK